MLRDRVLLVLSDIEMGAGGPTDDCPHTDFIAEQLLRYAERIRDRPIDFVFNGDTFDFLKTSVRGKHPRHVTETIALEKLGRIADAHRDFFAGIKELLERGAGRIQLHFITGNHDFELFFPRVQERIRALSCATEREIHFPGMWLDVGDVHIEHGSQGDTLFSIDPDRPFIEHEGERILNLPWGSVGLIEVALPYHAELYHLDRVKPKDALFAALPEAKALLMARARDYWARGFWRNFLLERDPLSRISWPIVKEVAYRFLFVNAEATFGTFYFDALRADLHHRLYVLAHEHVSRSIREGGKMLIQTGCLRNEYRLDPETMEQRPCEKSIAEIRMVGDRLEAARLRPIYTPDPEPIDLRELRPMLERHLMEVTASRAA